MMNNNVKTKVKVGVVGCGVVATAYYLPYLMQMENVELSAVCDLNAARAEACVRLFGAKAGNQPRFNYSPALRGANFRLTGAKLDAFLFNPQATVPGNRMAFAGTKPAESRQALMAYLKAATR